MTRPSIARAYDAFTGGVQAVGPDREMVDRLNALTASHGHRDLLPQLAQRNAACQEAAVAEAVGAGITQVLVAGSGYPKPRDLHHAAREADPRARVAYFDIETHAVLVGQSAVKRLRGVTYAEGDIAAPGDVLALPEVREVIDPARPVLLVAGLVLHFFPPADDERTSARSIVDGWASRLAAGSRIAVTAGWWQDERLWQGIREAYCAGDLWNYPPEVLAEVMGGTRLLGPVTAARKGPECLDKPAWTLCAVGEVV